MKKLLVLSLIVGMAAGQVFAEDGLTFSGEVKTGLNITKDGDNDAVAQIKHTDDAGTPGRIRLNFVFTKGNIQLKWRFESTGSFAWGDFKDTANNTGDQGFTVTQDGGARFLKYVYGMGDFLDNQIRLSLGKIGGDKPWETSGDEIWASIEEITGARVEFKPSALQGLNVGLLMPAVVGPKQSALKVEDYLQELGFGARYENDALDLRLALRLDSEGDGESVAKTAVYKIDDTGAIVLDTAAATATDNDAGAVFMYRLNAKAISSVVPGLSLWANGKFSGLATNGKVPDSKLNTVNWLYVKYASGNLTGIALRTALETWAEKNNMREMALYIKPVFSYKLTDWAEASVELRADLILAYQDNWKSHGKDPQLFDKLNAQAAVNFTLSPGATIKPIYILDYNNANGFSNQTDDAVLKHQFEVRLQYSF